MFEYRRLKSIRTRKILNTDDIEGCKPNYYVNRFQRRNPLRTDDIPGAQPPRIPRYTGRRSIKMITSKRNENMPYDSFIAYSTLDNSKINVDKSHVQDTLNANKNDMPDIANNQSSPNKNDYQNSNKSKIVVPARSIKAPFATLDRGRNKVSV